MRSPWPFLLLAVALAAPAGAATRNFGVTSFDRIRVDGPYRVRLATGVAPFARATGSPQALDSVSVEVQGRTLVVRNSPAWTSYPGTNSGPVEIELGTHELSQASLNGSGGLTIDRAGGLSFLLTVQGSGSASIGQAEVDQLRVSLAGTANATLAGHAGKLTANVVGMATLDAAGLVAKDALLSADGAATVKANVTNSATIGAVGPATFTLSGKPACATRLSGSASVSGCR